MSMQVLLCYITFTQKGLHEDSVMRPSQYKYNERCTTITLKFNTEHEMCAAMIAEYAVAWGLVTLRSNEGPVPLCSQPG